MSSTREMGSTLLAAGRSIDAEGVLVAHHSVQTPGVIVFLKYMVYVLRADNRGGGGTFALLARAPS